MDLLKWSPLDEKYRQPVIQELTGLFRVSWGGGDSWHSSKIIPADEKNKGIIQMTNFGQFDSVNKVKGPELV
jgi:hypothetical protein